MFLTSSWKIFLAGVVTSPNYPDNYPNLVHKTESIQVESGKVLRLEFTHFDVWACRDLTTCPCDYVKIIDGNGTALMDNSCGYSSFDPSHPGYFLPPAITSSSNRVEVLFHTNGRDATAGWSLSWIAVTPGECKQNIFFTSKWFATKPFWLSPNRFRGLNGNLRFRGQRPTATSSLKWNLKNMKHLNTH